jgi:hypothetical protein
MPKRLRALGASVREIRNAFVKVTAVRELRNVVHVSTHPPFRRREFVDLRACILSAWAATTVPALHMLDRVGSRFESSIATHRTSHVARSVNLHVHVQFILVPKLTRARTTLESGLKDSIFHAVSAPGVPFTLEPLIAAKAVAAEVALARITFANHGAMFSFGTFSLARTG